MKAAHILSLGVWLIPIVAPHAIFSVLTSAIGHASHNPLWAAAEIISLLVLQAVIYFILRKRLWFGLLAAPFAVYGANVWFGAVLPAYFLIERENKRVIGNQTAACSVNDYYIEPVRAGASLELERAGVAWISREQAPRYGLLDKDCKIKPIEGPKNFPQEVIESIRPDGAFLTRPGNAPPPYKFLAADSTQVWLEKTTAHVDDESFELQLPMPSSWTLLSYDAGEFLLARNEREVWTARKNEPARLFAKLDFGLATMSFRRVGEGYVYWEGYTEEPRAKLAWKLAKGSGQIEVPKGRSISSVSVNPDGSLIAVSVSSALNIGGRLDAVFVIDAATGQEVWRRLKDTWRSEIAFVSNTHLAVTIDRRVDVFAIIRR